MTRSRSITASASASVAGRKFVGRDVTHPHLPHAPYELDGRGALHLVDDLADTLVGLLDDGGETLGIGRITAVDLLGRRLLIETPVARADVARVVLGTEKFRSGASTR
jgi:hypothetical protein